MQRTSKVIIICGLLLNSFLGCMQKQRQLRKQQLPVIRFCNLDGDVLRYITSFLSVTEMKYFFQMCKMTYALYPATDFYQTPLEHFLDKNKERCCTLTRKQHLYGMMHYARQNNERMMGIIMHNEKRLNNNMRGETLYCFGYQTSELNDIKANIKAYKGIQKGRNVIDKTNLFFNNNQAYNTDVIQILLKNGVSAAITNEVGRTILHYIVLCKHTKKWFIKVLLNYGAPLNQMDCDGVSALDLALGQNNRKVAYDLIELGACITPLCFNHLSVLLKKHKGLYNKILKERARYHEELSKKAIIQA